MNPQCKYQVIYRGLTVMLGISICMLLTGCGAASKTDSAVQPSAGYSGRAIGGQQPISGATIQLYAVGSSGDGSAATSLIANTVTTDAAGYFTITGLYTCPMATTLVYLLASGGNPGLTAGTNNTAITLMVALGQCQTLNSATFMVINEVTTVAAVSALAPYITSATAIGSGVGDASSLAAAFTLANEYANYTTGSSPGVTVPTGYSVPTTQINTLADIAAACVNTSGGTAGDGSNCGTLFSDSATGGTPTDIVKALLNIVNNPSSNLTALLSLASANGSPFQPTLTMPPPNWMVALTTTSPALTTTTAALSFASDAIGVASAAQTVTLTNTGTSPITLSGIALAGSNSGDYSISSTTCGGSLTASSTCTVGVTFTPTAAGTRYADVAISNSASATPIYVALSGTGSTASSSTTLVSDFVSPPSGTNVLLTATVTSSGTPGGTITFYDGSTSLGAGTLSAGVATLSTAALSVGTHSLTAAYGGSSSYSGSTSSALAVTVSALVANNHILFVGDSLTHGRYSPVRNYNSANMTDANYGLTGARAESSSEPGPYGGIPGIFKEFTTEAGLNYSVIIEAISSTSLQDNYAAASSVIDQSTWNTVVLQEISTRPLTVALSGDSSSNPSNFCNSVKTIEQGVHAVAPTAKIFLYETPARGDEAEALGSSTFSSNLMAIANQYHNVYYSAMQNDGNIADVAATGDAWLATQIAGNAILNPYTTSSGTLLWFGYKSGSSPSTSSSSPDYLHPSIYGAYLNSLVLFYRITGVDPRTLGASEAAAAALGIPSATAVMLQQAAYTQVTTGTSAPINQTVSNPCSATS